MGPRVPFTAVVINGNGRRGREVGNDGFRMGRGRADCQEGEVGVASGDETRGRLVLTTNDMSDSFGSERQVRAGDAGEGIWGYSRGSVRVGRTKVKEKESVGFSERVFLKECIRGRGSRWGRVAGVGVMLCAQPARRQATALWTSATPGSVSSTACILVLALPKLSDYVNRLPKPTVTNSL